MTKKIGELLVEAGSTTADEVNAALAAQKAGGAGKRLGELLVAKGKVTRGALAKALAAQFELPFVQVPEVAPEVAKLVPTDFQVQHRVVAFRADSDGKAQRLHLAVEDPSNLAAVDELRFELRSTVVLYVAAADDIDRALGALRGDGLELIEPLPMDEEPPEPAKAADALGLPYEWAEPPAAATPEAMPLEDLFGEPAPSAPHRVAVVHFGGAAAKAPMPPPLAPAGGQLAPPPAKPAIAAPPAVPVVPAIAPVPIISAAAPVTPAADDPLRVASWPVVLESTPSAAPVESEGSSDVDLSDDGPAGGDGEDLELSVEEAEPPPVPVPEVVPLAATSARDIVAAADALEARLLPPKPAGGVTQVIGPRSSPAITVAAPAQIHLVATVPGGPTPVPGRFSDLRTPLPTGLDDLRTPIPRGTPLAPGTTVPPAPALDGLRTPIPGGLALDFLRTPNPGDGALGLRTPVPGNGSAGLRPKAPEVPPIPELPPEPKTMPGDSQRLALLAGKGGLEFSDEDLKILDSLEQIAAGNEPLDVSEKVKPARMVASLIRLLIKKNVINELEFLDELTRK